MMCFTPSAPTLLLLLLLFIISTRQHENKNRCCFVSPFCLTIPLCLLLLAGSSSSSQVSPQTPRRRLTLASLHPNQRRRLVWFNCTIRRRNPLRNGLKSTKRRRHDCFSCRVDEHQFVLLPGVSSTIISQTQIQTLWITFRRSVFRI